MIQYESLPIRPPSEARSLLVRATRFCPWGRCIFCYGVLWDYRKLEMRPVDDIKQDILAMKAHADMIMDLAGKNDAEDRIEHIAIQQNVLWLTNEGVKTAFIGDSDSPVMKTDDLVEVLEFLYKTFPTLERVTSYGRAKTALRKSLDSFNRLEHVFLWRDCRRTNEHHRSTSVEYIHYLRCGRGDFSQRSVFTGLVRYD